VIEAALFDNGSKGVEALDSMRDAQGKFLEQLMGDRIHVGLRIQFHSRAEILVAQHTLHRLRIHLLTERVQRESWVGSSVENFGSRPLSPLE